MISSYTQYKDTDNLPAGSCCENKNNNMDVLEWSYPSLLPCIK